jgi:hypothetical protein
MHWAESQRQWKNGNDLEENIKCGFIDVAGMGKLVD